MNSKCEEPNFIAIDVTRHEFIVMLNDEFLKLSFFFLFFSLEKMISTEKYLKNAHIKHEVKCQTFINSYQTTYCQLFMNFETYFIHCC